MQPWPDLNNICRRVSYIQTLCSNFILLSVNTIAMPTSNSPGMDHVVLAPAEKNSSSQAWPLARGSAAETLVRLVTRQGYIHPDEDARDVRPDLSRLLKRLDKSRLVS